MSGTTTNYGIVYPTSTDYVKDGASAIQTVATSVDTIMAGSNYAGLVLIKTQTIGTGVSSVTVTNAFSATYDAYKVIVTGCVASGINYGYIQLGSATSNYYFGGAGSSFTGTVGTITANNTTYWANTFYLDTNMVSFDMEIFNPFLAKYTTLFSSFVSNANGFAAHGVHRVATSYTDLKFGSMGADTFTGGTIAVYGYRKAI